MSSNPGKPGIRCWSALVAVAVVDIPLLGFAQDLIGLAASLNFPPLPVPGFRSRVICIGRRRSSSSSPLRWPSAGLREFHSSSVCSFDTSAIHRSLPGLVNLPDAFRVAALLEGVAGKGEAAPPEGLFSEPVPLFLCRFPAQSLDGLEKELTSPLLRTGQDGADLPGRSPAKHSTRRDPPGGEVSVFPMRRASPVASFEMENALLFL